MSRQKYTPRKRYLYALIFDRKRVYIGQSIDLGRRYREHSRDWCWPFHLVPLGSIRGTYADAEEYEYAWRYRAGREGFRVLGKSQDNSDIYEIDPRRRMNHDRYRIASTLRWPEEHRRRVRRWRWILPSLLLLGLFLASWLFHL